MFSFKAVPLHTRLLMSHVIILLLKSEVSPSLVPYKTARIVALICKGALEMLLCSLSSEGSKPVLRIQLSHLVMNILRLMKKRK